MAGNWLVPTKGSDRNDGAEKARAKHGGLDEKQTLFVKEYLITRNDLLAYCVAYEKDPRLLEEKKTRNLIKANVYRLMRHPAILQAIDDMSRLDAEELGLSRARLYNIYMDAVEMAAENSNPLVMVQAATAVGKMAGYIVDKLEVTDKNESRTAENIRKSIEKQLADMAPVGAGEAAKEPVGA